LRIFFFLLKHLSLSLLSLSLSLSLSHTPQKKAKHSLSLPHTNPQGERQSPDTARSLDLIAGWDSPILDPKAGNNISALLQLNLTLKIFFPNSFFFFFFLKKRIPSDLFFQWHSSGIPH
jgi:hypothetical protein